MTSRKASLDYEEYSAAVDMEDVDELSPKFMSKSTCATLRELLPDGDDIEDDRKILRIEASDVEDSSWVEGDDTKQDKEEDNNE